MGEILHPVGLSIWVNCIFNVITRISIILLIYYWIIKEYVWIDVPGFLIKQKHTKAMFGSRLPLLLIINSWGGSLHSFLTCRLTGVTFDAAEGAVPLRVPVRSDIEGTTDSSSSKMLEERTGMIQKGPLSIPLPKKILNMSPGKCKRKVTIFQSHHVSGVVILC